MTRESRREALIEAMVRDNPSAVCDCGCSPHSDTCALLPFYQDATAKTFDQFHPEN